jgi:hypothetical protein
MDDQSDDDWARTVNTLTKLFPENSKGGLVICGINWGGDPNDAEDTTGPRSFFSDSSVNKTPYRDRLVSWFALLGHPLSHDTAGPFERCIVQTNWLSGEHFQSKSMDGILDALIDPVMVSDISRRIRLLQPRLVIFVGVTAFDAFDKVASAFTDPLGSKIGEAATLWWTPPALGEHRRRAILAKFEHCNVIGLPHPTGQSAIPYAAIEFFKAGISPFIDEFKTAIGLPSSEERLLNEL